MYQKKGKKKHAERGKGQIDKESRKKKRRE